MTEIIFTEILRTCHILKSNEQFVHYQYDNRVCKNFRKYFENILLWQDLIDVTTFSVFKINYWYDK